MDILQFFMSKDDVMEYHAASDPKESNLSISSSIMNLTSSSLIPISWNSDHNLLKMYRFASSLDGASCSLIASIISQ